MTLGREPIHAPHPGSGFPLRLQTWLPARYAVYLRWLRHLLERLGGDGALAAWREAAAQAADPGLTRILQTGWQAVPSSEIVDVDGAVDGWVARYFATPIEGIDRDAARRAVEVMPPIPELRALHPSLGVWRETTAEEALHLAFHGVASLAEALVRNHGKQGELIAYDAQCFDRLEAGAGRTGSMEELIDDLLAEPAEPGLFAAGLGMERHRVSEREAVLTVTRCAWADYFRAFHPEVGYLLACSTDEAAYRAFNRNARLQRTTTLMEGAPACDFRVYAAPDRAAIEGPAGCATTSE
jgi:hypothetical protein